MAAPAARTVVVVDDEPDTLDAIRVYLESVLPGVRVATYPSAEAAMHHLAAGDADLIVCDYRMPGRNGLQFLEEASRRLPNVPRVLATAYPDLSIALAALNEARVARFLVKPLDPEALRVTVADLLGLAAARAP